MKPRDLIRALESVPETRLRLVELVHECVDAEGEPHMERLLPLADEVEMAAQEAREYVRGTEKVRWALGSLVGH